MLRHLALATTLALASSAAAASHWSLVNVIETQATTPDALRLPEGVTDSANLNRFGTRCPTAAPAAG